MPPLNLIIECDIHYFTHFMRKIWSGKNVEDLYSARER
jgi:hypothetical protein